MRKLLRIFATVVPGDFLRTLLYRNLIYRPRRLLREASGRFYRMDTIYEALEEARDRYRGEFSILEFGTAAGYSFTKMLYATRYLDMEERVAVHGFDTFEGLPEPKEDADVGQWVESYGEGDYRADYDKLQEYCEKNYANYHLHRGRFADTIDAELLAELENTPPILIWIDCDYYSSARVVMERLRDSIPSGCIIYFDDYEFDFGSRLSGEARLVHEIQEGLLGEEVDLVLDPELAWNSRRVYRFVRLDGFTYRVRSDAEQEASARQRTNDSPLP